MPEQLPNPNEHVNDPKRSANDSHAARIAEASRNAESEQPTGAGRDANPYDNLPHAPDDARGEVF